MDDGQGAGCFVVRGVRAGRGRATRRGAGVAQQARQNRRAFCRGRFRRFLGPGVRGETAGTPENARRHRQPRWRWRQRRRQHGREVARRRLHDLDEHQRAGDQPVHLQIAAVRPRGGFRSGRRTGDNIDRHRRQQRPAGEDVSGVHRLRQGASRQDELWLDGRWQQSSPDDGDDQGRDRNGYPDGAVRRRRAVVHGFDRRRIAGGAGAHDNG